MRGWLASLGGGHFQNAPYLAYVAVHLRRGRFLVFVFWLFGLVLKDVVRKICGFVAWEGF
jgi:hypothetical protein